MLGDCIVTADASGAARGAELGYVVVIVDVIDMSTTLEGALDAGALAVYGASFDNARTPVPLNPYKIGLAAGGRAAKSGAGIVVVAEPRAGTERERRQHITGFLAGVRQAGGEGLVEAVLPNIGAETVRLADMEGKVVVAITGSGGAAFDAAFNAGAPCVLTATVARTLAKKGVRPAQEGAERAIQAAKRLKTGICLVAASSKSIEDILAVEYLCERIISLGES